MELLRRELRSGSATVISWPWPDMTHVDSVGVGDRLRRNTGGADDLGALGREIAEQAIHRVKIPIVDLHRKARGEIDRDRRDQEADRRGDAGAGRADDALDAELARDAVGMHRTGAAEGDHRQAARIDAEIGRMHRGGLAHGFVDEIVDAAGAAGER